MIEKNRESFDDRSGFAVCTDTGFVATVSAMVAQERLGLSAAGPSGTGADGAPIIESSAIRVWENWSGEPEVDDE